MLIEKYKKVILSAIFLLCGFALVGCDRGDSDEIELSSEQIELLKGAEEAIAAARAAVKKSPVTRVSKPPVWNESWNTGISTALARNKISGCGEYRHISRGKGEFLVACTRDGSKWTGYIVFDLINKVVGPVELFSPPT